MVGNGPNLYTFGLKEIAQSQKPSVILMAGSGGSTVSLLLWYPGRQNPYGKMESYVLLRISTEPSKKYSIHSPTAALWTSSGSDCTTGAPLRSPAFTQRPLGRDHVLMVLDKPCLSGPRRSSIRIGPLAPVLWGCLLLHAMSPYRPPDARQNRLNDY